LISLDASATLRSLEKSIGVMLNPTPQSGLSTVILNGENPMQFTLPTARLLPQPVPGIVETADLQELRVEYGGTTWPARLYDSNGQTVILFPGQFVTIVGLEDSITLLITV
jgi:hypothetical protein